jgi:hypothetical protein
MSPRAGCGNARGDGGAVMSGCVSSSSISRSVAPAARCSSPHTSDSAPTELATMAA